MKPEDSPILPPEMRANPLLTAKEVANYLNITVQTLKSSVYLRQNLPVVKMGPRYYYQWSDVDVLIQKSKQTAQ